MPRTSFRFEGGKELDKALQALGDRRLMKVTAARALDAAAEPIKDEARFLAPWDEGDLVMSIKVGERKGRPLGAARSRDRFYRYVGIDSSVKPNSRAKRKRTKRGRRATIADGVAVYSVMVEFGTVDTPAQPFMAPAWEAKKVQSRDLVTTSLLTEIERTAARMASKPGRGAG